MVEHVPQNEITPTFNIPQTYIPCRAEYTVYEGALCNGENPPRAQIVDGSEATIGSSFVNLCLKYLHSHFSLYQLPWDYCHLGGPMCIVCNSA